jgi:predicted NBD/HSP70 family sugar kinase
MDRIVGISGGTKLLVAMVEGDRLVSPISAYPVSDAHGEEFGHNELLSMPMEQVTETVAEMVRTLRREQGADPVAVGMCFPGIIRDGMVEESPNLKQAKGTNLGRMLARALESRGLTTRVSVCNDADATATGIAAQRGHLEKLIRVWTLGHGVGYGRYPHSQGPFEGGHMVVTLDPKETYCGCGGRGHLEGIMGYRAMRLRFLDLEPEEVFAKARLGDQRCREFETLWHRALAAASASSIHFEGPGKFFVTGVNARFVQVNLLSQYLAEMVAMSSLQGSVFEVISGSEELAILGAAVNAAQSFS